MSNDNTIYELLTNSEVAQKVIDTIKVNNFWVKEFLTDNVIVNGDASEYYSSNPAVGLDYANRVKKNTKKAQHDDDKVYKCKVKVLINRTYKANISKDMLRIATGNPEKAEMLAALQANNLRKQLDMEIMDKCVEIVAKKENFADESWKEVEEKDFLRGVFGLAEQMKHPSDKFNKGISKDGTIWQKTLFSGESLKNFIIILNTAKKTDLRLEGAKTYNYDLIDLEKEFKAVYDAPLPALTGTGNTGKEIGALILHEESFALGWQIDPQIIMRPHPRDILVEVANLPGFVVGGPISFANMGAIIIKPTPVTILPSNSTGARRNSTSGGSGSTTNPLDQDQTK